MQSTITPPLNYSQSLSDSLILPIILQTLQIQDGAEMSYSCHYDIRNQCPPLLSASLPDSLHSFSTYWFSSSHIHFFAPNTCLYSFSILCVLLYISPIHQPLSPLPASSFHWDFCWHILLSLKISPPLHIKLKISWEKTSPP